MLSVMRMFSFPVHVFLLTRVGSESNFYYQIILLHVFFLCLSPNPRPRLSPLSPQQLTTLPSLSQRKCWPRHCRHTPSPTSLLIFFPTPPPVPTPCSIGASPAAYHRTSLPFVSTVVAGPSLLHLHTPLSPRQLFLFPLELHQQSTAVPALFLERHHRSPPTCCHPKSHVPTYLFFPSLSPCLPLLAQPLPTASQLPCPDLLPHLLPSSYVTVRQSLPSLFSTVISHDRLHRRQFYSESL